MIQTAEYKKVTCYHCGDVCRNQENHIGDKSFCCNGCKTVFEILNDHALCDYYALETHPGQRIGNDKVNEYSFLEEPSIADQLLNFQEGNTCGVTFFIPSIHCSSCIWLLEHLSKIQPGIIRSSIVFQTKQLDLQFDKEKVSLAQIASLLERLGYRPEITLEGKPINRQSIHKALLYKIGIAGFGFGNIMLLSIPEYVSFFGDFNGDFKVFFAYLSLLLSLPVFFYSASDYFRSAWNAIKNRMITIDLPIALGLIASFTQSIIEILSGTGMGYLDSLTGLIFFLLIGKWYQQKTYASISFQRDYKSYFPLAATVIKEDKETFVALKDLAPGDILLIRNQDVIPADSMVEKGNANIDYSFVTGESKLSVKKPGDRLYAGGRQSGESVQVRVLKKVSESYLTQLWNTDRSGKTAASGFVQFTNTVALYFTIAVLLLSIGTYSYWYIMDASRALHAAVSVLIIFCPCTLALAIPFCFGNAMNILSKNGFYLKNTATIEKLTDIDTVVFDKTGTITCAGISDVYLTGSLTSTEEQYVKSLAVHSSHPLSRLLVQHLTHHQALAVTSYKEIVAQGISGNVEGHAIKMGSLIFTGMQPDDNSQKETEVYVSIDGQIRGRFTFKNIYREGIPDMLRMLHRNYYMHLLSGDTEADKELMLHYFSPAYIHFRQSPADKLHYMEQLETTHHSLMVGDGLNDAGALLASTCGIAISDSSANFSPACDAILEADQLYRLPDFIAYSKACVKTVRWSIIISLFYNVIGLGFACTGVLKPLTAAVLMPVSSVSIVLFVTLISNLLARKYKLKN